MPKRGENIHKRKDGRWEARYKKGIGVNGKTIYGSLYANTYREVKAKLQLKLQDLASGFVPAKERYETVEYRSTTEIITSLHEIQMQISVGLDELSSLLGL